jgi:hypothetical protein
MLNMPSIGSTLHSISRRPQAMKVDISRPRHLTQLHAGRTGSKADDDLTDAASTLLAAMTLHLECSRAWVFADLSE